MKNHVMVVILFLVFIHSSCILSKKSGSKHNKVDTYVIVLDSNSLNEISPLELVELIKNKPKTVYILEKIPNHFCDSLFINKLESFGNNNRISANIIDGTESKVFMYERSSVKKEVSQIIKRINLDCESDERITK